MVKASLTLLGGTQVTIEGEPDEVQELIRFVEDKQAATTTHRREGKKVKHASSTRRGPQTLIQELINDGFFDEKRTISDVQKELAGQGHIYALNGLSSPLVRLVRSRDLRRIKEGTKWVYVNP